MQTLTAGVAYVFNNMKSKINCLFKKIVANMHRDDWILVISTKNNKNYIAMHVCFP